MKRDPIPSRVGSVLSLQAPVGLMSLVALLISFIRESSVLAPVYGLPLGAFLNSESLDV